MSLFDALDMDQSLDPQTYEERELALRQALIEAQFNPAGKHYPTYIVIGGLDGAGKGDLAHALNKWMDPRGIETNAFWAHSDEEASRPYYWRFWQRMPAKGDIGVFVGSWYSAPIEQRVTKAIKKSQLHTACEAIVNFERMLTDDRALVIKLWLHIDRDTQRMQLREEAPREQQNPRVERDDDDWKGLYKRALKTSARVISNTDIEAAPWHLIPAKDRFLRNIKAGEVVLNAMREHSLSYSQHHAPQVAQHSRSNKNSILDGVDLSLQLGKNQYKKALQKQQDRLQDLAWAMHRQQRPTVAVFEGWDAAGKGSAIRRVTQAIDPRLFKLVQFAAPTDEEKAHHYLWRFWRQLQRDGRATIFDRSWYGRVLVERVEGFATEDQWQRAYDEINSFEKQLSDHGCALVKFWIHISEQEQLERFKDREQLPHKRHKITAEDWRNRDKWPQYHQAVDDMVARTSTDYAPWTLVAGNNKRHARIQIIKTLCDAMEQRLEHP